MGAFALGTLFSYGGYTGFAVSSVAASRNDVMLLLAVLSFILRLVAMYVHRKF